MRFYGFERRRDRRRRRRHARPRRSIRSSPGRWRIREQFPGRPEPRAARDAAARAGPRREGRRRASSQSRRVRALRSDDLARLRVPMTQGRCRSSSLPDHASQRRRRPAAARGCEARVEPTASSRLFETRATRCALRRRDRLRRLARRGARAAARGRRARRRGVGRRGDAPDDLFAELGDRRRRDGAGARPRSRVPRAFVAAGAERDPARAIRERFALLYRLLWRLRARAAAAATSRSIRTCARAARWRRPCAATCTRCTRSCASAQCEREAASRSTSPGSSPTHHIVEAAAPFFVRRFANMRWSILTPERERALGRRGAALRARRRRADAPRRRRARGPLAHLLREHLQSRRGSRPRRCAREMPRKYWRNLPEAALIARLVRRRSRRPQQRMIEQRADGAAAARARASDPRRHAPTCPPRRTTAGRGPHASRHGAARCPLRSTRDPGRLRRRPDTRAGHVRRRAARRPGRPARPALRRPGRPAVRSRAGEAGHRPRERST